MFFFKKKNKEDKIKKETPASFSQNGKNGADEPFKTGTVDLNDPSLLDIDITIVRNGFTVYNHDQGRKQLDKRVRSVTK